MKKAPLLLVALWLWVCSSTVAQINDCSEAQVVCSSQNLAFNPNGPGLNDFADPDNFPGCITALEQNSAWYYFQIDPLAPPNLVLGFIIHPNGGLGEDYDWALYGPNVTCGALGLPIRCSSSSAACGFCPETGMGMGTTDVSEGPGTGDGFVMTLIVQPGQGFYLLIDNWLGTPNGFVLEWTDTAAPYLNCAANPPCALGATAGSNLDACEGEQGVQLIGNSNGNHGNETYSWSGTNGGTSYLSDPETQNPTVNLPPGFTGTIIYTLTVEEDTCSAEDLVELLVHPLPNVTINPIGPFCQNASPQFLTGSPAGGVWSGASTGNQFVPINHAPGLHTVTYTFTDSEGCQGVATYDVEVYELPEINLDPDPAEFCDSEGSILLTATGNSSAGGYTYAWSTPSGPGDQNTYAATISGPHNITVTDNNGCSNTSSITVTSHENPTVEIIDPGPICETQLVFALTATPPGGEFDGSVIDPSGELYPVMIEPGVYAIEYYYVDNNNCDGTDNINISIVPTPNAIAENNGPLCEGQTLTLMGDTDNTGASIVYNWSGPGGYVSTQQNPQDATLPGNYILEVVVDGCPSLPAVTFVSFIDTPEALPNNGGPYCTGETIQLFGNTSATGANISFAWTGPGGYVSNIQDPTDAILPGTYTLVVTQGSCSSVPATTEVTFSNPPDATATNNGPYCAGENVMLFGNTSSPGTTISYNWTGPNGYQSTMQNPLDATSAGTYQLVVDIDGCASSPITTDVVINAIPQPVITGQATFCTGFSALLDAGPGYALYQWSDNSSNQTLSVSSSGTYDVTVTDANGCIGNTSFTVTELSSLSPVITGTLSFCEGTSTVLDAGAGYVTYQWSTGENNQTIIADEQRVYRVTVTDADGCTGTTSVMTTENANPVVMIGGSTTFCIGGYSLLDAGNGYTSYLWSNDSTTQQLNVSVPGTYSVDVIDINGCPGSGSVLVTESTSLSPIITGVPAFCENGSTVLNAGSGFAIYEWSDGSDMQMLNVSAAGTYAVTVTDAQACSGSSSVMVTEVLPPAAQITPEASLCNTTAGGSLIDLYDLITSGDMSGTWQDVDGSGADGDFDNLDFDGVPAGDYQFVYTTNSAIAPCPETSYTVIITVIDCTCPDVFFISAPSMCNAGDVLFLNTLENTAEPGAWSLFQTPAGTQPGVLMGDIFDATNGDPGTYVFQYTLTNQPPPGCPVIFEVMVNVDPSVDAGMALTPIAVCAGQNMSIQLGDLLSGEDSGGVWSETSVTPSTGGAFNAGNGTFSTDSQMAGNYLFAYSIQSTGVCPDDIEEVSVMIHALPIVTIEPFGALDCEEPVQSLNAIGSSSGPSYSINWTGPGILLDGSENTLQPTIDEAGNYVLTILHTATGCVNAASVAVTANTDPPTNALITSQGPSCFGKQDGFIAIHQVEGGTPPYQYAINGGMFNNTPTISQLSAGTFSIEIMDVNGCRWDTAITFIEPEEINLSLGPDIEIELGEDAIVQASVNIPVSQIDTLIWSPSNVIACIDAWCLEGTISTFNAINLQVTLYDINGCAETDQIFIQVDKNRRVYIPTSFSPNGDGVNDQFYIFGDASQIVSIHSFRVFNRWGELMHQATNFLPNDVDTGWDGRFKNTLVNPGVFVYTAEIEFIDGVVVPYRGDITIVR